MVVSTTLAPRLRNPGGRAGSRRRRRRGRQRGRRRTRDGRRYALAVPFALHHASTSGHTVRGPPVILPTALAPALRKRGGGLCRDMLGSGRKRGLRLWLRLCFRLAGWLALGLWFAGRARRGRHRCCGVRRVSLMVTAIGSSFGDF